MRVMSVFGTRPEMIKMWATLKKLDELNFEHIMVHTGQNFTPELKDFFFKDLKIREPDFHMNINTSSYGKEVADVVYKSDELIKKVKPDALVILGDTYSGLSCMPASYHGVKIFHMEAGLRAWDKRMPEQRNRILIDHMSDILLPFRLNHRENLISEGIHPSKIFITGNTVFEAMKNFENQIKDSEILKKLSLDKKDYFIVTAHRSENVDNFESLKNMMDALSMIGEKYKKEVVYPMHPRTESKLSNLNYSKKIRIIKPLGFYDFNKILKESFCILSDSGTASEEGLYYGVPSISLRMTTERPETLESGNHIVAGMNKDNILDSVETITSLEWKPKYDFEADHSPSSVVISAIRSQLTNFF